jgi:hypothetical protein
MAFATSSAIFANENASSRLESYIFSDISFNLIMVTRQPMMKAYSSVKTE